MWDASGFIYDIAIAPSDSAIIVVSKWPSSQFRSTNGGDSWSGISSGLSVGALEIDPKDPNVIYAALGPSGRGNPTVYMSTDAGLSWTPRDNGLPNFFSSRILRFDPIDSNTLYCGTDVGVYRSIDRGLNWSKFSTGLPNVAVNDIRIFDDGSVIRAATFGRGIWETQIRPITIPQPTIIRASVNGKKLFVIGKNFDDGASILINGEKQKTQNDSESPRTTLVAKKAGKKIDSGDRLQIRNSDGMLSDEFIFLQTN